MHAPLETWPGNDPNLEQVRFLLQNGIREPILAILTRIGTVEGLGGMIRFLAPSDMQRLLVEDIVGTATAHLSKGLAEVHAGDEAGWEEEAGHDRMWYAVREIAFENPVTEDETQVMLDRMGIPDGVGTNPSAAQQRFLARRMFPDLDLGLELLTSTMLRVLFVEIKAFHVFAWAEELPSDSDLVAGDGEAARLVSHIRADETPHGRIPTYIAHRDPRSDLHRRVGQPSSGAEIIGRMWDASLEESLGLLEDQNRSATVAEIERALDARRSGRDLLADLHALADPAVPAAGR